MNAEKNRVRAKPTARHVALAALGIFAVGTVLVAVTPNSQSNKIGIISNNAVAATHISMDAAIVAQQAYGANSKLL